MKKIAALCLLALSCSPALAQTRLPTIAPADYTDEQKKAAQEFEAARKTHPHRFRDAAPEPHSQPARGAGTFGGFAADSKAGDDFFALSPEEKLAMANEAKRPKGW